MVSTTIKSFAEFICSINEYPIDPGTIEKSDIACRRRPKHKKCSGKLTISRESDKQVRWRCPACGDNGVIND